MSDWFDRAFPDPGKCAGQFQAHPVEARPIVMPADEQWFTKQVRGTAPEPPQDSFLLPPGFTDQLFQALRDSFAAQDAWYDSQRRPLPPQPWHTRLRWRIRREVADWRESLAALAYRAISGGWPCDGSDHY